MLRNLRADYSTVGLYCVTIKCQQIFEGSLQIAVEGVLPCWTQLSLASNAARQWLQIVVIHVVLYCVKKSVSEPVVRFPQVLKMHCEYETERLPGLCMTSVHRKKIIKDKQSVMDRFGRDARRLQLLFLKICNTCFLKILINDDKSYWVKKSHHLWFR